VSIQVDSPTTVITVQGFGDAEQGKKNKLLNSLEGVEGVETVEVTVNPNPSTPNFAIQGPSRINPNP
jgi:hypothetical protein